MKVNSQQILDFVLPKTQEGKQDDVRSMVNKAAGKKKRSGGILEILLSLLGLDGAAKNASLLQMLPQLLTMIKPDSISDVSDFLTSLLGGQQQKPTGGKRTTSAKKTGTAKKTGAAARAALAAKKSTAGAGKAPAKNASAAVKPAAAAAKTVSEAAKTFTAKK
jgi:hypothetical protein